MKKEYLSLAILMMLTIWLGCEYHFESEPQKQKTGEFKSEEKTIEGKDTQKKDIPPPIIKIINKREKSEPKKEDSPNPPKNRKVESTTEENVEEDDPPIARRKSTPVKEEPFNPEPNMKPNTNTQEKKPERSSPENKDSRQSFNRRKSEPQRNSEPPRAKKTEPNNEEKVFEESNYEKENPPSNNRRKSEPGKNISLELLFQPEKEVVVFNYIKNMDHLKIFKTVCLFLSLDPPSKCQKNFDKCWEGVKSHDIKNEIRSDEKNIKSLIEKSKPLSVYMATLMIIENVIATYSVTTYPSLSCNSTSKEIEAAKGFFSEKLETNVHRKKLDLDFAQTLFEHALDMGLFSPSHNQ